MKKWFTILCVLTLFIPAGFTYARDNQVLSRKVTLTLSNVTLEDGLKDLSQAAHVRFMYSSDHLALDERISMDVRDKTLRDVLDELLLPLGIEYRAHEQEASITLRKVKRSQLPRTALPEQINTALIYGKVLDAERQPMAGVSIYVKGTARGTTTDGMGAFTIEAQEDDVLIFSFIGFTTAEVTVGNQTELEVVLQESLETLDEVLINAGYWKVSDKDRTGNISRVTAADIEKQPVNNPLMALQGRMPGVVITQTSGVPGSGMRLQIRGQNSLRNATNDNGNYPLYVIDDVPVESAPVESTGALFSVSGIDPLNTLNPANIESIDILKDADATAIYGSRGANGVVLITTKKGAAGKMQVDVQAYASAGRTSNKLTLMNTRQYLAMRNEAFTLDEAEPGEGDYDVNGTWSQTADHDWQKLLVGGTAHIQDVQASLSGGTVLTSFRAGIGTHHETTVFPGNFGYRKITGNVNVNHRSADKRFTVSLTVNYGVDNNDLFNKNIMQDALSLSPNAPLYTESGALDWTGYTADRMHPLSFLKITHESKTKNLITSARLGYELAKGLRLGSSFGFTDTRTLQLIKTPQTSMNPGDLTDSQSSKLDFSSGTWIAEPQLTYSGTLASGRLEVLLGSTWQQTRTESFGIEGTGFISDGLLGNIRAARSLLILQDEKSLYRYTAFFGRIGYTYNERYLLNLTARRDGSSRFGSDNQFGMFGAVGAAWIFSEEGFIKNTLPVMSFGKLRASYGTTGNDRIGNYGYFSTYTPAATTYNGGAILNTTALANPEFGWEVNKKLEAALELGFFRDRLQLSFSIYRNRSTSQLVGYPLPASTGFTSVQSNLAATVQNTGVEVVLNGLLMEANGFTWRSGVNVTVPRNKLVAYPGIQTSPYANTYVVGKPLTISKRYKLVGVNPETGRYEVADADESGSFSVADQTEIINTGRKYFGGFTNTLRYKGIELDFLLEFVKQQATSELNLFQSPPGTMSNQLASVLDQDRWKELDDEAKLQRFTQGSRTSYNRMISSDRNVADASYVRMKSVALSWALPVKLIGKVKLREARVYVQAQNLFTITPFRGLNPEFVSSTLPPLRTLTTGIIFKL